MNNKTFYVDNNGNLSIQHTLTIRYNVTEKITGGDLKSLIDDLELDANATNEQIMSALENVDDKGIYGQYLGNYGAMNPDNITAMYENPFNYLIDVAQWNIKLGHFE